MVSQQKSVIELLEMLWRAMRSGEIPKSVAFYEAIKPVMEQFPDHDEPSDGEKINEHCQRGPADGK